MSESEEFVIRPFNVLIPVDPGFLSYEADTTEKLIWSRAVKSKEGFLLRENATEVPNSFHETRREAQHPVATGNLYPDGSPEITYELLEDWHDDEASIIFVYFEGKAYVKAHS